MGLRKILKKDIARMSIWSPFTLGSRWFRQRSQHELRTVLSQIEAIVRVNAPLPEGLSQCAFDAPSGRVAFILRTLSERIASGMSLADAMESMGSQFPQHIVAEVRAGETTGSLGSALRSVSEGVSEHLASGRDARNHTMYIGMLLIAEFGILSFLVTRVFPVFLEILGEFGQEDQSFAVRAMGWFTDGLTKHGLQIALAIPIVGFVMLVVPFLFFHVEMIRNVWYSLLTIVPYVRIILRNTQLHPIARALELRLRGGTPLPQALRDTANDDFPYPYRKMLERCARDVEQGKPLSAALARHRRVAGRVLPEIVRLGEAREDLAWAFAEASALTGRAARRSRHVWAQALVPIGVGICTVGVLMATVAAFTMFAGMGDAIIADL